MKFCKWIALTALFITGAAATANAQTAAIKTNLVGWATTNLNIGGELGVGRKSTVNLFGTLNPWEYGDMKRVRFWNVMPEYRYWFCEKFNGHFVGVHLLGGQYNVRNAKLTFFGLPDLTTDKAKPAYYRLADGSMSTEKKARHVEGWYMGAGITYGYQWMLSKHWNLEAEIGVGYAYSQYKYYGRCNQLFDKDGNPKQPGDKETNNINYFGPTKVGISIMYMF